MPRLLAIVLLLAAQLPLAAQSTSPTTVLLVRHAERGTEPAADPVITPAGQARAHALAEAVRTAGVTHIVTTNLQRTRLTAEPLAQALGLTIQVLDARSPSHVQDAVAAVRARTGGTVLVVGHSNTVPAIVNALGGQAAAICDSEYDNLYVLTLPAAAGPTRQVRARYGAATPVGSDCAPMVPVSK